MRVLAWIVVLLGAITWPAAATPAALEVTPPEGAVLAAPPSAVRALQAAPVEPGLVRARVAGPRGMVATGATVPADDPQAVVVAVPRDGAGTYRVAWWGMTTDGHPIAGTTAFAVRTATPAAAPVQPEGHDDAGVLAVLARFLVLVGVLGTAGMALVREWVMGGAWRSGGIAPPARDVAGDVRAAALSAAPRPVRRWWLTWWWLLGAWAAGLVVALPVQAIAVGNQWASLLGDSRWGTAWVGLAVLAVVAALAGVVARRADEPLAPSGARMYALAIPGLVGAMLLSWSGHAASGSDATLGVAFDIVHGWATAAWLGGLVMLLVLGMPLLRAMPDTERVRFGAAMVVRFSAIAVVAVVILVVTGVYRALAELPSLDALWSTDYGLALLAKLIVFGVMLVLAGWNRLVLHPRLERAALGLGEPGAGDGIAALRASVRAEVALGAAVMLAVAVLVVLMPPV